MGILRGIDYITDDTDEGTGSRNTFYESVPGSRCLEAARSHLRIQIDTKGSGSASSIPGNGVQSNTANHQMTFTMHTYTIYACIYILLVNISYYLLGRVRVTCRWLPHVMCALEPSSKNAARLQMSACRWICHALLISPVYRTYWAPFIGRYHSV